MTLTEGRPKLQEFRGKTDQFCLGEPTKLTFKTWHLRYETVFDK